MVPLDGALHGLAERRGALGRRAGVLGRVVAQSYPGPRRQGLDRRDEVEVLGLTQEADGVAPGLAAEAVVPAQLAVDRERSRLFRVERAQADPAGADPAQSDVLGDQGDQVRGGPDPFDVFGNNTHEERLRPPEREPERRCSPSEA